MALKPTIFKINVAVSDLDTHFYDTLNLTVAQHPSETLERMMARVLALCINAAQQPSFTAGLSTPNEPDLWQKSLDERILLWVDVGEPDSERVKKATRVSEVVKIYSFNSKSNVWWSQNRDDFAAFDAEVFQFDWEAIVELALMVDRTCNLSVTLTDNTAYFAGDSDECEVNWRLLE